jgi:(4S)-4-hydroxy-5-phosphonooxypentane-2,3-dione isomerase
MLVISAMVNIVEGKGDKYVAEFKKLAVKVRKDPGCITYVLNRALDNPDRFFVYEQYENEDAIKYHGSTPHFLAYRQLTADLVKSRDIVRWQQVV